MRCSVFFFFNDTATTEIYTLSLHDALPICCSVLCVCPCSNRTAFAGDNGRSPRVCKGPNRGGRCGRDRSEEHTSELQSQSNLVCRLLLEKKNATAQPDSACRHAHSDPHDAC